MKFHKLDDNWRELRDGNLFIQVKVYEEGSRFGINNGRVSKLFVTRDGKTKISYDRGWDVQPNTMEDGDLLIDILNHFP